ncbi:MAG TPA: DNA polymerase ligase N-terminal domain-containing protein [Gemmatimonadota bacterium]|nr:DNA polymerase ligase N-terminal domain-containing protein [Gemmatimonadota bacterium]
MPRDPLETYREKRDFRKTREPSGKRRRKAGKGRRKAGPRFVIQKHAARSLHYDFRLEADGVLKSWAVPKGPSTNPKDKRLAMPTEDHPLDYGGFEGVIPKGEYGAGAVIVWDRGTYRNLTEEKDREIPVGEALRKGHLKIWLDGEKIRGGYALTRIGKGKDLRWLLVKMDDEEADARRNPVSTEPESVLTGRTVEEVAEEEGG